MSDSKALKVGEDVPVFTAQEEAFLRQYSDTFLRQDALIAAGLIREPTSVHEQQAAMQQATGLIEKAEQLSLAQLSSALGVDKIYFLSRLKWVCDSDQGHIAVKGLQLLGRIHGLHEKMAGNTQVALIFNQATAPAGSQPPPDLPFTLASGDYRPFKGADNENEGTDSPDK